MGDDGPGADAAQRRRPARRLTRRFARASIPAARRLASCSVVIPFRGRRQEPAARGVRAGGRRSRCSATSSRLRSPSADVRRRHRRPGGQARGVRLGARLVADPGGGQGAAVAAGLERASGLCLVVNADLPRVRPSDLNALAVPRAPREARAGGGARRDDERARAPATGGLRAALRAGQRRSVPRPCGGARDRVRGPGARRTSSTTSTRSTDLERLGGAARAADGGAARSDRAVKVVCLSGGVGGAKLARGLHDVLAPGELTVIGNVGDDVEVLGLRVSPDLDSVLYALAGLERRGAGLGTGGRDAGARSRRRRSGAARRGSSSATSTSACTSCGRSGCAPASRSRPSPRGSSKRRGSPHGCCRQPTTRCAPAS